MRAAAFLLPAGLLACSLVVQAEREQCTKDADCLAHAPNAICVAHVCQPAVAPVEAGAPDAATTDPDATTTDPWGCLGHVVTQNEDHTAPVDFQFTFLDIAGNPLPDVSAKLCRFLDFGCQTPIGGPYVSDGQGTVTLPLYIGFRGYLDIAPTEAHPDLLPSIFYLPILDARFAATPHISATLGSTVQLNYITQQAGKPANPALGHIVYIACDCQPAVAADVTAQADPVVAETYPFYFDTNGVPSATQGKTAAMGTGGFINLTPGVVTLSYDHDGQRIGSQNVIIRQGSMSYVVAAPTP
jgi:hypothetical protein